MLRVFCVSLLLLFAACSADRTSAETADDLTPFFKLESYFDKEIARLDSLQPVLQKTVTLDDKAEEQRFVETDFEDELRIFRRSDINRPAWSDKYQIDSLRANGQLQSVRYTALDSSLNTRFLRVDYQQDTIVEIRVKNRTHSAIADTEQHLRYQPGKSYQIESKQKTVGSEIRKVLIEVKITN